VDWHHIKDWMEAASGLDMDALHVHAGMLVQLAAALLLRRPLRSPWPWLVVLGVETANEVYDYTYEIWPDRDIQLAEGLRDMWNTMAEPSLILLLARYAPALFVGRTPAAASGADPG
jgi:hypothetical protein